MISQNFYFHDSRLSPQEFADFLTFTIVIAHHQGIPDLDLTASMAVLFQIYAQIIREYHPGYLPGSTKVKILSAQAYIRQNLADRSLSVKALAARSGMSEVHFRRLFHKLLGICPAQYIQNARVSKVTSMLGLSELRLEDIAAQTGFSSAAHLCAVFKTATGLTPSHYRRSNE